MVTCSVPGAATSTLKSLTLGFGYTLTVTFFEGENTLFNCMLASPVVLAALGNGQAGNLIFNTLVELDPQLLTGVAVTVPAMVVAGYETVILVVPCPEINVPAGGIVQLTAVALGGI